MLYDITVPISVDMVRWPGDPPVSAAAVGEEVRVSRWSLGSHAGTHVDAPAHFSFTDTVDTLDARALLGPCTVIELPHVSLIGEEHLRDAALQGVKRLLIKTDNSGKFLLNAAEFHENYAALDVSAAHYLHSMGMRLVGIDYLSIEPFAGSGAVHEILLGAGIVILEGVNLAVVPAGEYELICAPLKLQGADGAPARVWLRDE